MKYPPSWHIPCSIKAGHFWDHPPGSPAKLQASIHHGRARGARGSGCRQPLRSWWRPIIGRFGRMGSNLHDEMMSMSKISCSWKKAGLRGNPAANMYIKYGHHVKYIYICIYIYMLYDICLVPKQISKVTPITRPFAQGPGISCS